MKKTLAGFFLGLIFALSLTLFAGENPLYIASILFKSAFGSRYDLGLTLFYTTPLVFCGLSVAVAFHAGLFNIGAEGQLTMATLAATALGVALPSLSFPFAPLLALMVALLVGALWGFIAGWLKAVRGSHEVVVTIMLNFIAAGIASWFVLHVMPNPNSQNPESALVGSGYMLKDYDPIARFFPDTPVSMALIVAIMTAIGVWVLLWKTTFGFELRTVGYNPDAANRAGISEKNIKIIALCLAGALAGFVSLSEVMGSSGQFKIGFSADYGFVGIAVALLARNHPIGVIFAAFLMGALHKGASDLDLETTTITRDFSKIIQSLIILGVTSHGLWSWSNRRRKDK
ncbi:MAG: ABC transporter permease [Bdellovibrionaceae bacterium]|nr:ABC transporter permease [Pseudobdellovibrionaceae bacterium]